MNTEFGNLTGLNALVTGASSGIGRAIALELATGGANVIIHCATALEQAREVVLQIEQMGCRSTLLTATFSRETDFEQLTQQAWSQFGKLDILINNAGIDLLTGEAAKWDYAQKLQHLLDVDVYSTAMLSRCVGEQMKTAGSGVILNLGWDQADRGMAGESGELFATAKNSIMGLTRSLAVSFAPEVRVNCIAPGWIKTKWGDSAGENWQQRVMAETPLKRWGKPEDIAKMARFLVSPAAEYVTGQVINVNGGAVR